MKFLIRTDYGVLYGKDHYSNKGREPINEEKCFSSRGEADDAAERITDRSYKIVSLDDISYGTLNCQHCDRDYPHQHIIDKKGHVHSTILTGNGVEK